jgi:hypothetical protein
VPPGTRDIRVVHEIDGILDPVHPTDLYQAGRALWSLWTGHDATARPDLLLGLDAGGILPTVAVALASNLPYRLAWKPTSTYRTSGGSWSRTRRVEVYKITATSPHPGTDHRRRGTTGATINNSSACPPGRWAFMPPALSGRLRRGRC